MIKIDEFWARAWQLLRQGATENESSFSTATLATVCEPDDSGRSSTSLPRSRTVVLRGANQEERTLRFYTDFWSKKVCDIRNHSPNVSWCFWDAHIQFQIIAAGKASLLPKAAADSIFNSLPKHARKAYAALSAPGSISQSVTTGLPQNWPALAIEETEYARNFFTVVECHITEMDVLRLARSGNLRLRGTYCDTKEQWVISWVVP